MASQLKVDTLTGVTTAGSIDVTSEGNSTTTNLQQGLCKAWVNFNGTGTSAGATITPNDSFNTGSITDVATGDYTHAFTNNFVNAHYVGSGSAMFSSSTNAHVISIGDNDGANGTVPSTSSYEFRTGFNFGTSVQDCTIVSIGNVGDLA